MTEQEREAIQVLRAQSGDRQALDTLFQKVQQPLHRYIFGLVDDPGFADDTLQVVLLQVYRKLRWLRDPALFRPWCYRIASRETFRRLRAERRWSAQIRDREILENIATTPADPIVEPALLARLPDLIGSVSPASRVVLVLHYLDHLSLNEVASTLNVSLGTVKSRLAFGLVALRRLFAAQNVL